MLCVEWKSSYQERRYFNFHLSVVIHPGEGVLVLPFASLLYGHGGGDMAGSVNGIIKEIIFLMENSSI